MKKLFAVIMIMLFGLSSSGATLQLHYCCGKLKSVTLVFLQQDDCCAGEKGNTGCCKTTSLSANEKSQDHELFVISIGVKAPVEPVTSYDPFTSHGVCHKVIDFEEVHSYPPLTEDIFIRNCVFRI